MKADIWLWVLTIGLLVGGYLSADRPEPDARLSIPDAADLARGPAIGEPGEIYVSVRMHSPGTATGLSVAEHDVPDKGDAVFWDVGQDMRAQPAISGMPVLPMPDEPVLRRASEADPLDMVGEADSSRRSEQLRHYWGGGWLADDLMTIQRGSGRRNDAARFDRVNRYAEEETDEDDTSGFNSYRSRRSSVTSR